MKHFFFIDPLEKLQIHRDTSLFMAQSFQAQGEDCFVFFTDDFFLCTDGNLELRVHPFRSQLEKQRFYLKYFKLLKAKTIKLEAGDVIHMRLDPPFDERYLMFLWMLQFFKQRGVKITNDPDGILLFNEKLAAYTHSQYSLPSYVGQSEKGFLDFTRSCLQQGYSEIVLKPLNLFEGKGVMKLKLDSQTKLISTFQQKKRKWQVVVAQPFQAQVQAGEVRALYFRGQELGSILKKPKPGTFLSNIAQGASFEAVALTPQQRKRCEFFCRKLKKQGIELIGFDLLGDIVMEVNITCPALLVEASTAHQQNLALGMLA